MERNDHESILHELVHGEWCKDSQSVHTQIEKVRALIGILGRRYYSLDPIAFEIETISGTSLGCGGIVLLDREFSAVQEYLARLRDELNSIDVSRPKS